MPTNRALAMYCVVIYYTYIQGKHLVQPHAHLNFFLDGGAFALFKDPKLVQIMFFERLRSRVVTADH